MKHFLKYTEKRASNQTTTAIIHNKKGNYVYKKKYHHHSVVSSGSGVLLYSARRGSGPGRTHRIRSTCPRGGASRAPFPGAATAPNIAPPVPGARQPPVAPVPSAPAVAPPLPTVTFSIDKTAVDNGGAVTVKGQGVPGKPVYLEVWSEKQVKSSFFDSKPDKDGKRPYKLYLTHSLPASYKIYAPKDKKEVFDAFKAKGKGWAYSDALKEMGADVAYTAPAKIEIDAYQSTIMAGIIGSRGEKLPTLDDKETRRRAMQLTKARFAGIGKLISPSIDHECGRILFRQG